MKDRARRVNKEGNTRMMRLLRLYLTSVSFFVDGQEWMDILERLMGKNCQEETECWRDARRRDVGKEVTYLDFSSPSHLFPQVTC